MSMLDVGDGVGRAQPVGDEDLARGHTEPGPEDIGVQSGAGLLIQTLSKQHNIALTHSYSK
ncbi:hypothetical protein OsI_20538 [Oryza sativa Indica Group]|uniref:Uncharacterized protein n=1 Tax=Oryza sativa subsp. indica TaxID=39946 RepID=B8AZR8_ORYSI|nr:hypothetical protein OsI_20538 [Oryza sativa Indica Group]